MFSRKTELPLAQKILYVEDQLDKNISRLQNLFGDYLDDEKREQLEQLEPAVDGYATDPQEIQKIFKGVSGLDIEYRFPNALAKILQDPGYYTLFIIDRNLTDGEYTFDDVYKIDPHYSRELHTRFSQREGDYLLLKLAVQKKVDVLDKFYFLTAYPAQSDQIRSAAEIKSLVDFGAFQQTNIIEKGNKTDFQRLQQAIQKNLTDSATLYVFDLNEQAKIKGTFGASTIKIQTTNGRISIDTAQLTEAIRLNTMSNPDFLFKLKQGDSIQGQFVEKKINVKTHISPRHSLMASNIKSITVYEPES
jgi:hypothetical protein